MKRKISIVLVAMMLVIFTLSTFSFATEVPETPQENLTESGEEATAEEEYDIQYKDIFEMKNEDYEMNLLVDGNAYIMVNGDVKITGEVNGSVFVMANGTVELSEEGSIADSLYIMAKKVVIKGFAYDLYSASEKFEMTSKGYISRDINLAANEVKLMGFVKRNANISAGNIIVKDNEHTLEIGGDFNYTSENQIEGLSDIVLNGEINYSESKKVEIETANEIKSKISDILTTAIYLVVIYFLLKILAPKFIERIGKDLQEKSIVNFAIGLLSYLLVSIIAMISILVLLTGLGVPISLISWIILIAGFFISPAVFQIAIFEVISKKYTKIKENIGYTILTLVGIAVCISLLEMIPVVSGIVKMIVLTTGVGLVVRNAINRRKKEEG